MPNVFIQNYETRLASIKADVLRAHEPETKWQQYNGTKQAELMQKKIDDGTKRASDRLFELGFELQVAQENNQNEISKTLYPDFFSNYSDKQRRGEANRMFSFEVVEKLENVLAFKKLYDDTINLKDHDLATRLLDAGENRFKLPNDKLLIEELKQRHVQELGLNELLIDKNKLNDIKKAFEQTKRMYSNGVYNLAGAKNAEEFSQMLFKAGLAV